MFNIQTDGYICVCMCRYTYIGLLALCATRSGTPAAMNTLEAISWFLNTTFHERNQGFLEKQLIPVPGQDMMKLEYLVVPEIRKCSEK